MAISDDFEVDVAQKEITFRSLVGDERAAQIANMREGDELDPELVEALGRGLVLALLGPSTEKSRNRDGKR